jgi:cold shock protein
MKGTVKWYNIRKGYGFIKGEDEVDYFIHHSALGEGVFLRENDLVSFEAADTDKGKQAQNVVLEQKGSERTDLPAEEETTEESSEKEAVEETEEEPEAEEESTEESSEEEAVEETEEEPEAEKEATEE